MLKKVLKYLLYAIALVCLWLLSWRVAVFTGRPGWLTWALFFAVAGLVGAAVVARRMWIRRQARLQALRNILLAPESRQSPQVLREKWKEGLGVLRNSALRKSGNPVYALPWYLMLGAPGSGKTAALMRARVQSPMANRDPSAAPAPTPDLDWFFFDRSVILDCSGRFSDLTAPESSAQEWEELIGLLARARRREPLNGVVVTIDADRLRAASRDELREQAWFLRRRIVQLMKLMDARFPIYVIVTKIDHLYGLNTLTRSLPPNVLAQPLAFVTEDVSAGPLQNPVSKFLDDAFAGVSGALKDLRLALLGRSESGDARFMLFPNELERLRPGLEEFMAGLFADDAYLETPMLRGLFFTSAEQSGTESSNVLAEINPEGAAQPLPGTTRGIFLHDLFARIIPEDRYRFRPLTTGWRWDQIGENMGLASWVVLNLAAGVALCFAFLNAFETLQRARSLYPSYPAMSGSLVEDLPKLDKFREFIRWMSEREEKTLTHWTPFHRIVDRLQDAFTADFCRDFGKFVVPETEDLLERKLKTIGKDDPSYPLYVDFLTAQVNVNLARSKGAGYAELRAMAAPRGDIIGLLDPRLDRNLGNTLSELMVANVAWRPWTVYSAIHLVDLRKQLDSLVENGDPNMRWLIDWANQDPALKPVTLDDFWPVPHSAAAEVSVPAAYTGVGRAAISDFLARLETAVGATDTLRLHERNFRDAYAEQALDTWYRFAAGFDRGKSALSGEAQWRQILPLLGSVRDPYFSLMAFMGKTFASDEDRPTPAWIAQMRRFNSMRAAADRDLLLAGAADAAGSLKRPVWDILLTSLGGRPDRGVARVKQIRGDAKLCAAYIKGLEDISRDAGANVAQAEKLSAALFMFNINPQAPPSELYRLYGTLDDVRKAVADGSQPDPVIWSLIDGPVRFIREYTDRQAGCYLQAQWNAEVLWPLNKAATRTEINDQLYGPNGTVWDFVQNTAAPFVQRASRNYSAVSAMGGQIPFTADFFAFLNRANAQNVAGALRQKRATLLEQQSQMERNDRLGQVEDLLSKLKPRLQNLNSTRVDVTIEAFPFSVNQGARAFPFATYLTVQCGSGAMRIANYNFPAQGTFTWSPSTCGDTMVTIEFQGGLALTRRYTGPLGFAEFVKDFYDGRHRFTRDDFPDQAERMTALGIDHVTLFYRFSGQAQVLAVLNESQNLPDKIAALEAEQQQLRQQQQDAKRQELDSELASLDHVAPIKGGVPREIAQCWNPPAGIPPSDGPAPRRILRAQSR
jgi:type VI secretion system protein ImpL